MLENQRGKRFEIIQPGISISSKYSTNGTLGLIVYDLKNNNKLCVLSNWHILAKSSKFGTSFRRGRPIHQPGKIFMSKRERRSGTNIIAKLSRFDRRTDSAIAEIISREYILNQYETDKIITGSRKPKIGDLVEKSGARTGVTRGEVVKINGSSVTIKPVNRDNPDNIEISDGGDSGCLWYDPETLEGLILHSAGETNNSASSEFARGHMLETVLSRLSVSLTDS